MKFRKLARRSRSETSPSSRQSNVRESDGEDHQVFPATPVVTAEPKSVQALEILHFGKSSPRVVSSEPSIFVGNHGADALDLSTPNREKKKYRDKHTMDLWTGFVEHFPGCEGEFKRTLDFKTKKHFIKVWDFQNARFLIGWCRGDQGHLKAAKNLRIKKEGRRSRESQVLESEVVVLDAKDPKLALIPNVRHVHWVHSFPCRCPDEKCKGKKIHECKKDNRTWLWKSKELREEMFQMFE